MALYAGLDLSLTGTGIVLVNEKGDIQKQQLIKTNAPKNPCSVATVKRVAEIRSEVLYTLNRECIHLIAVEGFSFGSKGRSLFEIAFLGYAVREGLYQQDFDFIEPTPGQLKKFVSGKGNAPKNVVMLEVFKRWGVEFADDNLADAYVLAQMARSLKAPIGNVKLTQFQQEVIRQLARMEAGK